MPPCLICALSLLDARAKAEESGADGVMLGRAIFGNPWLFHPEKDLSNVSLSERFRIMVEHTHLFEELLPHKNFAIMKKHYKAYLSAVASAKEDVNLNKKLKNLRLKLMDAKNASEVEIIINDYLTR